MSVEEQSLRNHTGIKAIFYSPLTQVIMLAVICFMCPGLYNALTGLGGGGQLDESTQANANTALYATSAISSLFAGTVYNRFGARLTLQLGTVGYALYVGSFLSLNIHPEAKSFVVVSGAILGVCAGLLWNAQGALMLAYPTEGQKGRYISIFWSIFNLGGVLGAAISLGQNFRSTVLGNSTYIVFLVLTCIGCAIPMLMANPKNVIRSDGSPVVVPRRPSWKAGLWGLWTCLRDDPYIIFLFPMFFASNWFYTWQFNDYNGALFNIRGRALNNLVLWSSSIVGSIANGLLLDNRYLSRRSRAFAGWVVLLAMVLIVNIWAYFYQKNYTRASVSPANGYIAIDIDDSRFPARVWLMIFCGLLGSMWQTTSYWIMGAMSNDPAKLAYLTGFYKALQCAGAAVVWRAVGVGLPFMNIFISTWALLMAGLVCALPMIYFRIRNHTDDDVVSLDVEPSTASQPSLNDEKDHDLFESKSFLCYA
ncbi:MFS general substrate transporter [Schizopora paradoxa]|uniref:MFS general substrate transporter n=1 Tax=Schizopora paradoxa TaxID=27342 RepID=A0A0H2R030_9AGAM|nr:MFS general substrate transporter [Schizopora paradoxa]